MKTIISYSIITIILSTVLQLSSCIDDTMDNPVETTGQAMFWVASDLGVGSITVICNNISLTINSYYSSGPPSCGASGTANFTLSPGTYPFNATGGSKTWNGIITVTSGGCSTMQLTSSGTGGSFSLNGKWSGSDGRIIKISGANGVFNSFGSGNWKSAEDKGFVKVGDLYLKNISNINSTKWNAQPLWISGTNGVVEAVKWGADGTITMGSDGNTITLTGTSPFSGSIGSAIFTRIN